MDGFEPCSFRCVPRKEIEKTLNVIVSGSETNEREPGGSSIATLGIGANITMQGDSTAYLGMSVSTACSNKFYSPS